MPPVPASTETGGFQAPAERACAVSRTDTCAGTPIGGDHQGGIDLRRFQLGDGPPGRPGQPVPIAPPAVQHGPVELGPCPSGAVTRPVEGVARAGQRGVGGVELADHEMGHGHRRVRLAELVHRAQLALRLDRGGRHGEGAFRCGPGEQLRLVHQDVGLADHGAGLGVCLLRVAQVAGRPGEVEGEPMGEGQEPGRVAGQLRFGGLGPDPAGQLDRVREPALGHVQVGRPEAGDRMPGRLPDPDVLGLRRRCLAEDAPCVRPGGSRCSRSTPGRLTPPVRTAPVDSGYGYTLTGLAAQRIRIAFNATPGGENIFWYPTPVCAVAGQTVTGIDLRAPSS
jgi:hypothetical protein